MAIDAGGRCGHSLVSGGVCSMYGSGTYLLRGVDDVSVGRESPLSDMFFSKGRQLLQHFTRNRLSPSTIHAYLGLGACGRGDLLHMEDLLAAVTSRKRKQSEREPEDTE